MNRKCIGKVTALEKIPSTVDDFYFWTKPNVILAPFDVVIVDHVNDSLTYAIIEEISHITDASGFLADFISNDFGEIDVEMNTSRVGMNYVHARVVGNSENIYIPVHNGSKVWLGTKEDINKALGLESKGESTVACGCLQMYTGIPDSKIELPVYVDARFLIGPEGAHLNISGISGLATKTSYAMFLLNALQQRSLTVSPQNVQDEDSDNGIAYIFMNVKGRDLLTIDHLNETLQDSDKEIYRSMGLQIKPFQNVKYYYPLGSGKFPNSYVKQTVYEEQRSQKKAFRFAYHFCEDKDYLELLFSDIDDPNQTMESIINYVITGQGSFSNVDNWTWENFGKAIDEKAKSGNNNGNKDISVLSWRKFARVLKKSISNAMFANNDKGNCRLEDEIKKIKSNDVYVVDVAKQDENMQAFVFGSVMQAVQNLKLGVYDDDQNVDRSKIPSKIIVFVDELNKYASNDVPKSSPILRLLLDIAERGRSLGIVLFSAEQFKSAIHKRITGNCATHAYGRTNSIEVAEKAYSYIPNTFKNIMTRLKQGQYVIQNPTFNSLLKVSFPRPLYQQDKGELN